MAGSRRSGQSQGGLVILWQDCRPELWFRCWFRNSVWKEMKIYIPSLVIMWLWDRTIPALNDQETMTTARRYQKAKRQREISHFFVHVTLTFNGWTKVFSYMKAVQSRKISLAQSLIRTDKSKQYFLAPMKYFVASPFITRGLLQRKQQPAMNLSKQSKICSLSYHIKWVQSSKLAD